MIFRRWLLCCCGRAAGSDMHPDPVAGKADHNSRKRQPESRPAPNLRRLGRLIAAKVQMEMHRCTVRRQRDRRSVFISMIRGETKMGVRHGGS